MRIKYFFIRNKLIIAAFFLPVLLAVIAMAVAGIYPFGGDQIAVIDMYHQYVPFLSELQYKLHDGGSLFYTWDGAGGSNFWNLLAYYGASPLNLLLALFPEKLIMEAVAVILLIKIGLAGAFMAMYLRYTERTWDWAAVAFSTMYALSSYVMAYYWCIMWMDAVALLPLCILGLSRLMDGKSAVLYTVALALTVFANYYIAIMVCIFILFYYPVLYFLKNRGQGVKKCAATTGRAVGYSFLAIGMAAVMLLPTYISMQNTFYISSDMPETMSFYNDALDVLNQLLPYSQLTYREGLPNLYCGMLVVILLVIYLTGRSFSLREKLLNCGFLVFMFLSLNINTLDFIWHGFHFPNQLPYRYTFVICFILIGMAYRAFRRLDDVGAGTVWKVFAAGMAYYLVAQKLMVKQVDDMSLFFYGGIAWLLLYCAVLLLRKRKLIMRGSFIMLVVVVTAAEMLSSACTALDTVGDTQRASYFENYEDVTALAETTRGDFARTEMDQNHILNCPALYHYRGLSQFSSSINANATALMEKIGLEGEPGKNRYNYNQTDPVTNAILNVKYLIAKNLPVDDPDFTEVERSGNSVLYESRYPLSIGYVTGTEIRTWDTHSDNPFRVLDDYVRAATGGEYDKVFETAGEPVISAANATVENEGGGYMTAHVNDGDKDAKVTLTYKADATQKYYVFIEADNAEEITVYDDREEYEKIGIMNDCGSIVNIGTVEEGETFDITVKYGDGGAGSIRCHVEYLDYDAWDGAYDILSERMLDVTDSDDGYIKGTVDAGEGGMLVTSVPYEEGWTLKVDGEKRDIQELVGGVFISTALDAGSHEIELTFRPPGIWAGLIVTLASILLLAFLTFARKRFLRPESSTYLSAPEGDEGSSPEECDCSKRK